MRGAAARVIRSSRVCETQPSGMCEMAVQGRVEAGSAGGRRFNNLGVRADPGWRPGSVTAEMDGDAGGGGGGGFAETPRGRGPSPGAERAGSFVERGQVGEPGWGPGGVRVWTFLTQSEVGAWGELRRDLGRGSGWRHTDGL